VTISVGCADVIILTFTLGATQRDPFCDTILMQL
jgi:hypothetical protein